MLVETQIDRLSQFGEGIGRVDGRSIFVDETAPGDRAIVEVDQKGKTLRGRVVRLLESGPSRRASRCPISAACGGCDWLHLEDLAQLEAKKQIVLSALERIGRIARDEYRLIPGVAAPQSWGYRRRAVLHLVNGRLGFFERRSHQLVPVETCPALVPALAPLPMKLSAALGSIARDIDQVTLLEAGAEVALSVKFHGHPKRRHTELVEQCLREMSAGGAVITWEKGAPLLVGKPILREPAPLRNEVALSPRPDVFVQANASAIEYLARAAIDALQLQPKSTALELFCGIGTFTFAIAGRVAEVFAVEASSVALGCARSSAAAGMVKNVRFVQGDATEVSRGLVEEGRRFDRILLDPPRTGASGIGPLARELGASRIVYVSCDAGTLARDAADLVKHGFRPDSLEIVDMFPQTRHVEAVMAFERG